VVHYLVTAVDQCNFSHTDTATVTVNQTISIDSIAMTPATCIPSGTVSAFVSGTTGNVTYTWSNGQNGQSLQNLSGGWYQLTITDQVCSASDSVFVTTINAPIAAFTVTPGSGCSPLNVVFTNNSSNANSYSWDFGNGQTASSPTLDSQNAVYTTDIPTGYTVLLTASQGANCQDTQSLFIPVNVCDCADAEALNYNPNANVNVVSMCTYPYPEVVAPNVITPDGDGINDFFELDYVNVVSIELFVFNRWGSMLYSGSSNDVLVSSPKWDGKNGETEAKEGVYTYTFKATGVSGGEVQGHGFFHLIR
jgi:gliding motility-associated-like protein